MRNLDDATDLRDGLALADGLSGCHKLEDDLYWRVPDTFNRYALGDAYPFKDSHSTRFDLSVNVTQVKAQRRSKHAVGGVPGLL